MLYSTEQRLNIYKQAYDRLNVEILDGLCTYICPNLWDLGGFERVSRRTALTIKNEFPEFYAQKPPNATDSDPWWEDDQSGNAERRIALLNAMIICNREIKNKP